MKPLTVSEIVQWLRKEAQSSCPENKHNYYGDGVACWRCKGTGIAVDPYLNAAASTTGITTSIVVTRSYEIAVVTAPTMFISIMLPGTDKQLMLTRSEIEALIEQAERPIKRNKNLKETQLVKYILPH